MKSVIFFVATAIFYHIVVGNPQHGHHFHGSNEGGGPFHHHPWGRNTPHHRPGHHGYFGNGESSQGAILRPGSDYSNKRRWQNGVNGGFFGTWPSSTTENPIPSPQPPPTETGLTNEDVILACVESCPVTAEYNPVCGSNNVTYPNPGRLHCEQTCGVAVQLSKLTACSVSEAISTEINGTREEVVACIRQCPVTAEYNPVCGSNNVTYANPGRLTCEQDCGIPVQLVKLTACVTDPITTPKNPSQEELIAACIRTCPVTGEFNPVCGTNNETYSNPGRLECAQNCGANVHISRHTSCDAPATEEEIKNATPLSITNSTIARPFINENGGNNSEVQINGNKQNNNVKNNTENNGEGGNNLSGGNSDGEVILGNSAGNIFNGENNKNPVNKEKEVYHSGTGISGFGGSNVDNSNYLGNNCNGINNTNNKRTPTVKEFTECMQLCPLTSESIPVCGTDNITYMNPGRLLCAQFCGVEVRVKKFAACLPTSTCNCNDCPPPCIDPPVTDNPVEVTPPPNLLRVCLEACPTVNVSKPVCGTNNVTYKNIDGLLCAKGCGVDVSLLRETHCSAPGRNPNDGSPPVWSSTEKPTLQKCVQQCSVRQQYEPVCGTDNVTYNDIGHLICARQCGLDVQVKILSPCPSINPSTETSQVTTGQNGLNFTIPPEMLDTIWTAKPTEEDDFELDQRFQDGN